MTSKGILGCLTSMERRLAASGLSWGKVTPLFNTVKHTEQPQGVPQLRHAVAREADPEQSRLHGSWMGCG